MSATEEILRGPRGGDLTRERDMPAARNAHFSPENGNGLHRMEPRQDAAVAGRQNEKPWHRMAAALMVDGVSNIRIAELAGVTPICVSQIRAQRWFQELLAKLTIDASQSVLGVLQSEALNSLNVMVDLRDSAESERVRYAAAKDLLELAHGKAVQRVVSVSHNKNYSSSTEEMQELQNELASLRAQREQKET